MQDCLFCKIMAGEIPSKKVYEDEDVITLEDLPDLKTYKIRKGL